MFCCCIFAYFCCNCKGGPDYDSSSPVIIKTLILKSLTTTGKVGPAKEDAISIQLCTSSVQFSSPVTVTPARDKYQNGSAVSVILNDFL